MAGHMNAAALHRLALRLHRWLPYRLGLGGRAFPAMHYYLELTRRCNLRCTMCQYIEWLKNTPAQEQREGELSTEEWHGVIDQIPWYSLITLTGGEPLLRKDFAEILGHACARHRTHFISNATLMDEERARVCAEAGAKRLGGAGLNFVGVSLDGPEAVHDEIRAMPGGFRKSAEGIGRLLAHRDRLKRQCPLVHVTTVIQEKNLEHLAAMPGVAKSLGADVLNFTLEVRIHELDGFSRTDPGQYRRGDLMIPSLDAERLRSALAATRRAAAEAGVELRMPNMPDEAIIRYYNGDPQLDAMRCGFIWSGMFVGCKGILYPCWLQPVGDVRKQRLRAVWNNAEMRAFRRRVRKGLFIPCAGCCFLVHAGD